MAMSQHSRLFRKSDRYREKSAVHDSEDPRGISTQLNIHAINIKTAIRQLENTRPIGVLWAGELAIEQAYREADLETAFDYLDYAQFMFKKADYSQSFLFSGRTDVLRAKARKNIAILPAHKLALMGKLPPKEMAESIYQQTTLIGHDLVNEYRAGLPENNGDTQQEFRGEISEFATWLLLQRFANTPNGIGSESWYVFPARYLEDRRNLHGATLNRGWDLSVIANRDDKLMLDYKLQIRSALFQDGIKRPNVDGISIVYLNPDIKFASDKTHVGSTVIEECFFDLYNYEPNSNFDNHLKLRTDMLLDVMDRTANSGTSEPLKLSV